MKKVLGAMSKFIFGAFGIAVLALLMTLTYGALQKLFPGNFSNQIWGLVMFDIAAMCWAICFVFLCRSTGQYAVAGLGFVVAFLGTLGMVAAEVMLSGQDLAEVDTSQIGTWMVYGFIIVTAIHAALIYAHHALAPDIAEQINVGVARGEIVTEAIHQATQVLDVEKQQLATTIRNDIVSQAKRDLGLIEADPQMPFLPKAWTCQVCNEENLAHRSECIKCGYSRGAVRPALRNAGTPSEEKPQSFFLNPRGWLQERFGKKQQTVPQVLPQMTEQEKERAAMSNTAMWAWYIMPDGSRQRIWCKTCLREGKPAFTVEPCEHILMAKPEMHISGEEVMAMLEAVKKEARALPTQAPSSEGPDWAVVNQKLEDVKQDLLRAKSILDGQTPDQWEDGTPRYHPTNNPKPEPSGSTRPPYNSDRGFDPKTAKFE